MLQKLEHLAWCLIYSVCENSCRESYYTSTPMLYHLRTSSACSSQGKTHIIYRSHSCTVLWKDCPSFLMKAWFKATGQTEVVERKPILAPRWKKNYSLWLRVPPPPNIKHRFKKKQTVPAHFIRRSMCGEARSRTVCNHTTNYKALISIVPEWFLI